MVLVQSCIDNIGLPKKVASLYLFLSLWFFPWAFEVEWGRPTGSGHGQEGSQRGDWALESSVLLLS